VTTDSKARIGFVKDISIDVPADLLAKDTLLDRAEDDQKLIARAAQGIDNDLSGEKVSTAPTLLAPPTPVPPPPSQEELPPAPLYESIGVRLEPSMVAVGATTVMSVTGIKIDGSREEITDGSRLGAECVPPDAGTFTFGVFSPTKEGTIVIRVVYSDAGGAKFHKTEATLTVNAAEKVALSKSLEMEKAAVSPTAPTQLAAPVVQPPVVTTPAPASKPKHKVVAKMKAVTADEVPPSKSEIMEREQLVPTTWQKIRRNAKWPLVGLTVLLAGTLVMYGCGWLYRFLSADEPVAVELPSAPSVPEATVTDVDAAVAAPMVTFPSLPPGHDAPTLPTPTVLRGSPGSTVCIVIEHVGHTQRLHCERIPR
jgi:hypothetical protein